MEDIFFKKEDIPTMSKEEMWNKLDGKIVKCFTTKKDNCQIFTVYDIENNQIYLLDYSENYD